MYLGLVIEFGFGDLVLGLVFVVVVVCVECDVGFSMCFLIEVY